MPFSVAPFSTSISQNSLFGPQPNLFTSHITQVFGRIGINTFCPFYKYIYHILGVNIYSNKSPSVILNF